MTTDQKKRILIFSLTYFPRFASGAEMAVREIVRRLPPDRYAFDMVTLRLDASLPRFDRIDNIEVHRIGPTRDGMTLDALSRFPWYFVKILFIPLAFLKALELNRVHRYDALWSIMTYMGFPAVLFKFLHRDVKFILTLQDGDTPEHIVGRRRIRIVYPLFRQIFRKADCVQAISTYLATFARTMGYPGKPVVVPNGVDLAVFHTEAAHRKKVEYRDALGIKDGYKILVTSSRLVHKNAVDDIIRSLSNLPRNIVLFIAGSGPNESELRELALDFGVADRLSFLGNIPHRELAVLLSIADVFVRPSRSEGMGSSFLEAMAAGVPVIATPVGGITDFVFDPSTKLGRVTPTGLFCKVNDPESVAASVKYYLKNEHFRHEVSENAKRLVREKYDWGIVARDMVRHVFEPTLRDRS